MNKKELLARRAAKVQNAIEPLLTAKGKPQIVPQPPEMPKSDHLANPERQLLMIEKLYLKGDATGWLDYWNDCIS